MCQHLVYLPYLIAILYFLTEELMRIHTDEQPCFNFAVKLTSKWVLVLRSNKNQIVVGPGLGCQGNFVPQSPERLEGECRNLSH